MRHVQLHVHLDGCIRHETIWEVMRRKGLKLPGSGSLADLKLALQVQEPEDLLFFLSGFKIFLPAIKGDLAVIERIAHEFVEDQAKEYVAYCEARFCPHLLLPNDTTQFSVVKCLKGKSRVNGTTDTTTEDGPVKDGEVTVDSILNAVLKGFSRGEEDFGTKVRVILCCIHGTSEWYWDILRLCEEYRSKGVVGIDLAGYHECSDWSTEDQSLKEDRVLVEVFEAAREKGIHRTIHAGEAGPASTVKLAVEALGAERIGHGYRVVEDESIYQMCLKENIHFEVCPHSSYLTGSIGSLKTKSKRHPVLRFAEDEASFSINTDDPTITNTQLMDEYKLLTEWGFTEAHFTRANFQAAIHSFLPIEEKKALVDQLHEAYGIVNFTLPSPTVSPSSTRTSTPPPKPSVTFGTWAERA
ncbi:Adenosine deaminase-like 1 [Homarus americanus]|uniref:Adenosine deaminase n=1 Tax=Homarus americanus TaxID=6706 RepID=A0A8J5JWF4_HOMAM|nr:Adenosine deaminase-like 1 [Homarus americanus]